MPLMFLKLSVAVLVLVYPRLAATNDYPWHRCDDTTRCIASEIRPPSGFRRIRVESGSFGDWLRHLPLKQEGAPVLLYNGEPKVNQSAHVAVVDIDTGTRDLQQCADAVIRLRAEYLYSRKRFDDIHFNFTSGHEASFRLWISGYRAIVDGNEVRWIRQYREDSSYSSFREYLKMVFTYAGTHSLSQELEEREDMKSIQIGDVFIQGGFPGHAVIVVDIAEDCRTGDRIFLLAQSYMPAQDIHILKNPNNPELSPWYRMPVDGKLRTPQWTFSNTDLKYFPPG